MGLPVPHGFTVTCEACNAPRAAGRGSLIACWRRPPRTCAGWEGG